MTIADSTMTAGGGLDELFGAASPLASCIRGFAPRPEQRAMAEAVASALATGRHLIVEAGTGTGKTLAYLVPILISGQRVVVSTRTKTLQDQLFHRDLPALSGALGRPVQVQLLKGRSNYLCLHRFDAVRDDVERPGRRADYRRLETWAGRTRHGDIAEISGIAEDSSLWPRVTSTAENCLGAKCPRIDDCHVFAARKAARDADVVVVNHHLLMADLALKDEGFGDLLPGADAVIVDEAHQFPDVAQSFFNTSFGNGQLLELIADTRRETLAAAAFDPEVGAALDGLAAEADAAWRALPSSEATIAWSDAGETFAAGLERIAEGLVDLAKLLDGLANAPAAVQRCRERSAAMLAAVDAIVVAGEDDGVRWLRRTARRFTAVLTPLDASSALSSLLIAQAATWVFTSATLAVGDDFEHFQHRLGALETTTRQIPSPFAYPDISLLYLPSNMPSPNDPGFVDACIAALRPVLDASRGRAFVLFTSHRALRRAAELLRADDPFEFPLFVQGEAPRSRLLESFAASDGGVLLGTSTFWEGVDIRGHGLVLVVIDRLPFASPGDPLLAARLDAISRDGGNPFRDYQLPQAVLTLKQGVGRLIRDYDDYGVVMICDPRIHQKHYGRVFLASLPPLPVSTELDDVERFYAERSGAAT